MGAEWRLKEANHLKSLQAAGAGGDAFVHFALLCPLVSCPPLAGPRSQRPGEVSEAIPSTRPLHRAGGDE